jgi:hypothetical protein
MLISLFLPSVLVAGLYATIWFLSSSSSSEPYMSTHHIMTIRFTADSEMPLLQWEVYFLENSTHNYEDSDALPCLWHPLGINPTVAGLYCAENCGEWREHVDGFRCFLFKWDPPCYFTPTYHNVMAIAHQEQIPIMEHFHIRRIDLLRSCHLKQQPI